jgi:hypothetical protein
LSGDVGIPTIRGWRLGEIDDRSRSQDGGADLIGRVDETHGSVPYHLTPTDPYRDVMSRRARGGGIEVNTRCEDAEVRPEHTGDAQAGDQAQIPSATKMKSVPRATSLLYESNDREDRHVNHEWQEKGITRTHDEPTDNSGSHDGEQRHHD